jgi:hypothetical protein
MSWYDDIWAALWAVIKIPFEAILKAAETFAVAGITSLAQNGGMLLIDTALEAVKMADESDKPGLEKFGVAFDHVVGTLEKEGVPVVTNSVRLAIELAVAQLKTDLVKPAEPATE